MNQPRFRVDAPLEMPRRVRGSRLGEPPHTEVHVPGGGRPTSKMIRPPYKGRPTGSRSTVLSKSTRYGRRSVSRNPASMVTAAGCQLHPQLFPLSVQRPITHEPQCGTHQRRLHRRRVQLFGPLGI